MSMFSYNIISISIRLQKVCKALLFSIMHSRIFILKEGAFTIYVDKTKYRVVEMSTVCRFSIITVKEFPSDESEPS